MFSLLGISNNNIMMSQHNIAEEARRSVGSAIAILPRSITASYALASMQVPHRVLSESDPFLFLVSEGRDPYKAAIKVATYWAKRSNIFGNRVHLPMNQTCSGTLTQQDISCLKDFCLQLLPADSLGRTVYVIDAARVPDFRNEADSRCIFYQLQFAIGNVLSATEGIVILLHLSQHSLWGNLDTLIQVMAKLIGTAMPFHLRRFHILSDQNTEVAPITTSAVVQLVLAKSLSKECIVTIGASPQDFLSKLLPLGLDRQGLPSAFGGFQTIGPQASSAGVAHSPHSQEPREASSRTGVSWMDQSQSAASHGMSSYQQSIAAGVAHMPSSQHEQRTDAGRAAAPPSQEVDETDDDRKPRARTESELDTSPRKRSRADSVITANSSHDEENDHGSGEDNGPQNIEETTEEKLRKRNAIYSRRKYIRKKIEIEVFQDQHKTLSVEKQRLLCEQARLEGLISQAAGCVEMYNRGDFGGLAAFTAEVARQRQQQMSALSSNATATAPSLHNGPTSREGERQERMASGSFTTVATNTGGLGQVTTPFTQGHLSPLEALALSAAATTGYRGMAFNTAGQGQQLSPIHGPSVEAMARAAVAAYTGGARSIAELQVLASMTASNNIQQAPAPPSFYDRLGQEAAGFFASPTLSINHQTHQLMAQSLAQRSQASQQHANNLLGPDFAQPAAVRAGASGNQRPHGASKQDPSPHDTKEED
jgi:hypothetical protein